MARWHVGEGWRPWVFGTVTMLVAGLTAFYMSRLFFMTFHGKPRASSDVMHHVHESPQVMLVPLYILGVGALVAGSLPRRGTQGARGARLLGVAPPVLPLRQVALQICLLLGHIYSRVGKRGWMGRPQW